MTFQDGEEWSCRFIMTPRGQNAVEIMAFFDSDCMVVRATHAGDEIVLSENVARAASVAFDILYGVPK